MEGRELHRFPKGQTCSECPARRYYLESGFRYCQNGHRVEVTLSLPYSVVNPVD